MPDNACLPLSADPRAYRKVPNSDELAADVETILNRTRHGCLFTLNCKFCAVAWSLSRPRPECIFPSLAKGSFTCTNRGFIKVSVCSTCSLSAHCSFHARGPRGRFCSSRCQLLQTRSLLLRLRNLRSTHGTETDQRGFATVCSGISLPQGPESCPANPIT